MYVYMNMKKVKKKYVYDIGMYYFGWDRLCLRKGEFEEEERGKIKIIYVNFFVKIF